MVDVVSRDQQLPKLHPLTPGVRLPTWHKPVYQLRSYKRKGRLRIVVQHKNCRSNCFAKIAANLCCTCSVWTTAHAQYWGFQVAWHKNRRRFPKFEFKPPTKSASMRKMSQFFCVKQPVWTTAHAQYGLLHMLSMNHCTCSVWTTAHAYCTCWVCLCSSPRLFCCCSPRTEGVAKPSQFTLQPLNKGHKGHQGHAPEVSSVWWQRLACNWWLTLSVSQTSIWEPRKRTNIITIQGSEFIRPPATSLFEMTTNIKDSASPKWWRDRVSRCVNIDLLCQLHWSGVLVQSLISKAFVMRYGHYDTVKW